MRGPRAAVCWLLLASCAPLLLPLLLAEPATAGVPQGLVAYFTGPGQTTCPNGWHEAQYAQGRLILSVTDPKQSGIQVGTPMKDGQPPEHSHPYTATAKVGDTGSISMGGSDKGVGASGNYNSSGTTASGSVDFPFAQFLVCEADASASTGGDSLPYATVAFFNPANSGGGCPANWTINSAHQGRFILSLMPGGIAGYTTSEAWLVSTSTNPPTVQIPTHTHTFTSSISLREKGFVAGWGAYTQLASPGSQTVTGTASANTDPIVPVVTLLACQKSALGLGTVPLGLNIFFSAQQCPTSWGQTTGAPGRFFVGIPGTGTQGYTFGAPMLPNETQRPHTHWVAGSVTVPNQDTDLTTTWGNLHIGRNGSYDFGSSSDPAMTSLPYVVLQSCTAPGTSAER
jgi:hypothetical protein